LLSCYFARSALALKSAPGAGPAVVVFHMRCAAGFPHLLAEAARRRARKQRGWGKPTRNELLAEYYLRFKFGEPRPALSLGVSLTGLCTLS
jgi:hypothetical protein